MFPAKLFHSITTSTRAAASVLAEASMLAVASPPAPFNCHLEITSFLMVPEGSARR